MFVNLLCAHLSIWKKEIEKRKSGKVCVFCFIASPRKQRKIISGLGCPQSAKGCESNSLFFLPVWKYFETKITGLLLFILTSFKNYLSFFYLGSGIIFPIIICKIKHAFTWIVARIYLFKSFFCLCQS